MYVSFITEAQKQQECVGKKTHMTAVCAAVFSLGGVKMFDCQWCKHCQSGSHFICCMLR